MIIVLRTPIKFNTSGTVAIMGALMRQNWSKTFNIKPPGFVYSSRESGHPAICILII